MTGGNVTEKITPETYEEMNRECESPSESEEQIDDWQNDR